MFFLIALTATITQLVTFIISEIATQKSICPNRQINTLEKLSTKTHQKKILMITNMS